MDVAQPVHRSRLSPAEASAGREGQALVSAVPTVFVVPALVPRVEGIVLPRERVVPLAHRRVHEVVQRYQGWHKQEGVAVGSQVDEGRNPIPPLSTHQPHIRLAHKGKDVRNQIQGKPVHGTAGVSWRHSPYLFSTRERGIPLRVLPCACQCADCASSPHECE